MVEYVYALHDFQPEHEDEVPFRAGEPVEVIEKDDLYNDGWWKGRNISGRIGLFPQTYTTPAAPAPAVSPAPPMISTQLPPASLPASPPVQAVDNLPVTDEQPESQPDSPHANEGDARQQIGEDLGELEFDHPANEEVMKATMTDVQKAIEQLGHNDRDGARSFSFASSRDGDTTDHELTDREGELGEDGAEGEDWHRDARYKLAENSRKVVEAAAAAETESSSARLSAPPIEVEMSDESEVEDVDDEYGVHHPRPLRFSREHPHIPEEDEDEESRRNGPAPDSDYDADQSSPVQETLDVSPSAQIESAPQTAKAADFVIPQPVQETAALIEEPKKPAQLPILPVPILPPAAPSVVSVLPMPPAQNGSVHTLPSETSTVHKSINSAVIRDVANALPSPALSSFGAIDVSKHSSVASSSKVSAPSATLPTLSDVTRVDQSPKKAVHPSEWNVDEVIEWLKSKGFGPDVCDRFIEQEITGDVLLELDINLLKTEIGIPAFGKRMRIANAITELRRPPSLNYSDIHTAQSHSQSQSFSFSQSQSYPYSHSHNSSTQHSLNSPLYLPSITNVSSAPLGSAGFGSLMSPESPLRTGDLAGTPITDITQRASDPPSTNGVSFVITDTTANEDKDTGLVSAASVGLGIGLSDIGVNGEEAEHTLSPNDGSLHVPAEDAPRDEDIGALSDTEAAPSILSKRRHLFSRSKASTPSIKEKVGTKESSKDGADTPIASPAPKKRQSLDNTSVTSGQARPKKGDSASKAGDRLSLFGGSFSGPLSKSRKPAPRYASGASDATEPSTDKSTGLSRLYGSKRSSTRPSIAEGSTPSTIKSGNLGFADPEKDAVAAQDFQKAKEVENGREEYGERPRDKDAGVLRKRTLSTVAQDDVPQSPSVSSLTPGKSIVAQIGIPDHTGWMRKKGDRYNSWKLRYFIIKGPHLYILRSNSKTETKIKGYINIQGYKVIADENVNPGRYGFRIVHDTDKTHYFSSEEQSAIREWMKAIMKATIGRDYSKPVISSVNIPTIPLTVAQAMNPAPRPPSPTARAATQKALRRENPNQLSTRDARILMGLPSPEAGGTTEDPMDTERARFDSFFTTQSVSSAQEEVTNGNGAQPSTIAKNQKVIAPPRPSREVRRQAPGTNLTLDPADLHLIEWANTHLPQSLQIMDVAGPLCGGLALLRLAESIKGKPAQPPVPDSAFPSGINDDKLDGLFKLFDFLLDNDVKMGSVSINDVRQGKRDKILQLLKALKTWDEKRKAISQSMGQGTPLLGSTFGSPLGLTR